MGETQFFIMPLFRPKANSRYLGDMLSAQNLLLVLVQLGSWIHGPK